MQENQAKKLVEEETSTYDFIASHFSATRFSAGPWILENTKSLPHDTNILDIGCGNGRLLEGLQDSMKYTGIDVSAKLIEIAKKKYPSREASFKVFDGIRLPFKDASFSHVYMLYTFHHFPKPLQQKFINECKRVVKPGGEVVVTIWHLWRKPFLWYLLASLSKKMISRKFDLFDIYIPWKNKDGEIQGKRYFHMFRKHELEKLFINAGFSEVNVTIESFRRQKNFIVKAKV